MAVEHVSGGSLFPSWRDLLLRGADRVDAEGKQGGSIRELVQDEEPAYLPAAERLRQKLGATWASYLRDEIDLPRSLVADESLALPRAIWRLGSPLILTTNYDRVLDWACPEGLRDDLKVWDIENAAQQAEYLRRGVTRTATVWHLHGRIDRPSDLILTPDGFRRLYSSDPRHESCHRAALHTLRSVLAMRSLLFIGFSLDDKYLGMELQGVLDVFEGHTGPHYALIPREDRQRLEILDQPVEPVTFEGFGRPLVDLVERLGDIATPAEIRAPTALPPRRVDDEVPTILLYAHDKDRPLVAGVRRFLWQQGFRTEEVKNDPLQPVGLRRDALARASALLIFHAEVDGRWVEARLKEAVKIVTSEQRPFVFAVFLGVSNGDDLTIYEAFRCFNFHLLDHRSGFRPEAFDPFLTSMGRDQAVPTQLPESPFVGLRPFGVEESSLFHGRDEQIQDLLEQLHLTRFVAVLGNSGCGKSSLVRAGLIPALEAGWLVANRDRWRVATLRPGARPIESLVASLAALQPGDPLFEESAGFGLQLRAQGAEPLLDALAPILRSEANLLFVVDQFEEIFRFGRRADPEHRREAEALVHLLLELSRAPEPIYVILLMRADFLGECDSIRGLPEALNRNQYVVPRLSRRWRREAIEGPIRLYGRRIDPQLVDQLLDEAGEAADQLPILQHALMRIWESVGASSFLGLEAYRGIGELDKALSRHADEVYVGLSDGDRQVAEWVLRALTDIDPEGRRIRRPRTLAQLVAETGYERGAIERVVDTFREAGRAFLMPPRSKTLGDKTLIDISHESLIRQWNRLRHWVDLEGESGGTYRKLEERARAFAKDGRNPLVDRDLEEALDWFEQSRPPSWLERYGMELGPVGEFISTSRRLEEQARQESLRKERALEEARRNEARAIEAGARRARRLNVVLLGVVLVALGLAFWARLQSEEALRSTEEASYNLARVFEERSRAALDDARKEASSTKYQEAWFYALAALKHPGDDRDFPKALGRLLEPEVRTRTFARVWQSPASVKNLLAVAISPDGRRVASGGGDQAIRIWDMDRGRNLAVLEGHTDSVASIAFSPDGRHLLSGAHDQSLRLWDLESPGAVILEEHSGSVTSVAFGPRGRRFASGSLDRTVKVWDRRAARCTMTLEGHSWYVTSVAFSPDGRILASGGRDQEVIAWDLETGEEIARLEGHLGGVSSLAFVSDQILASGSEDTTLRLWDLETAQSVATLEGHRGNVVGLALGPDGRFLASGSWDQSVRLWDLESYSSVAVFEGHSQGLKDVAYSPDGHRLVSSSSDASIRVWDIESERAIAALGGSMGLSGAVFSSDGQLLATTTREMTIQLWNPRTGLGEAILEADSVSTWSLAISPDSKTLAVGLWNGPIRLWDLESRKVTATLKDHTGGVMDLAFSPDSRWLASGSADRTIGIWNLESGLKTTSLEGHSKRVSGVDFSPDGRSVASSSQDQTVRIWDLASGRYDVFERHSDSVLAVAYSPDGQLVASVSSDQTIRVWDPRTGVVARRFDHPVQGQARVVFGPDGNLLAGSGKAIQLWELRSGSKLASIEGAAKSLAISPDGRRLATTNADQVSLWDIETLRTLASLGGHRRQVRGVVFSPEGRFLASGSSDGTVRIWNVETGREVENHEIRTAWPSSLALDPERERLGLGLSSGSVQFWDLKNGRKTETPEGLHPIWSVAFSSDGRFFASGSDDTTIQLWDPENGDPIVRLEGHTGSVSTVTFSPSEGLLASGSSDETVRLWNPETGRAITSLEGHSRNVTSVAFSPDGRLLASGSVDRTIRVWDHETSNIVAIFEGHPDGVSSVAFSPDGRFLAAGTWAGTVWLWDVETQNALAILEGHAKPVSSVAFNPASHRLASGSRDGAIRFWEATLPNGLRNPDTRTEAFGRLYRASLEVLGHASDGIEIRALPRRIHLIPINGYRFPEEHDVPAAERPRPAGEDVLDWLLRVGR